MAMKLSYEQAPVIADVVGREWRLKWLADQRVRIVLASSVDIILPTVVHFLRRPWRARFTSVADSLVVSSIDCAGHIDCYKHWEHQ